MLLYSVLRILPDYQKLNDVITTNGDLLYTDRHSFLFDSHIFLLPMPNPSFSCELMVVFVIDQERSVVHLKINLYKSVK